jgi:hypothetical protein
MLPLYLNRCIIEPAEPKLESFYLKSLLNIKELKLVISLASFLRGIISQFYPNEIGQAKLPLGLPNTA